MTKRVSMILAAATMLAASHALAAIDAPAEFKAVCDSAAVKSEKLESACAAGKAPDTIKDGSRFKKQGIGPEVDTLYANLKFFTAKP